MTHAIVGYGQVGRAIHRILGKAYIIDLDKGTWNGEKVDVVHICIPYKENFEEVVEGYKILNKGALVIVHSTTPLGVCDKLEVVHSPIRGVHPHLEEGIRVFPKYFGGKRAEEAAKIFKKLGITTKTFPDARTTEALKLWDTTQYGRLIMMQKEIHQWCKKNKVDFNIVYTMANQDYNKGYIKLGRPEVVRPYLKHMDGPIGGHCVVPNAKLLNIKL